MKRILLMIALLALPNVCKAQTANDILNLINQNAQNFKPSVGTLYAVREHQFKEVNTITVASYQNSKYSWLNLGVSVDYAPSDFLGGGVYTDLGNLSQFKINVPIVSQLDAKIGYAYGYLFNDSSRKTDGGPIATIAYKF